MFRAVPWREAVMWISRLANSEISSINFNFKSYTNFTLTCADKIRADKIHVNINAIPP